MLVLSDHRVCVVSSSSLRWTTLTVNGIEQVAMMMMMEVVVVVVALQWSGRK